MPFTAAIIRTRKKLRSLGESLASYANSTFTAASATGVANGSTPNVLTLTLRNLANALMPGRAVTFTAEVTVVNADESTVSAGTTTPAANEVVALTIFVRNAAGVALPNIAAARIVVSATGANNTIVQPTGPTNKYGEAPGASIASSTAGARTITVTVDGIALSDTPIITTAGGGAGLIADIQWDTTTGTSDNAITDGNNAVPFNDLYCGATRANVMEVVTGVSGSPTTNCLRITQRGSANCGNAGWTAAVSPIAASTSHYGRVYFRVSANFTMNHGVSYKVTGTIEIVPFKVEGDANGARFGPAPARDGENVSLSYPYYAWYPGIESGAGDQEVALDTWYRYEWFIQYTSADNYRIYPRLYNAAGTLLYDADTYYPVNASPATESLTDYYAAGNVFGVVSTANAREFAVGYEGPGGAPDNSATLHLAALAFSTAGWIGAL